MIDWLIAIALAFGVLALMMLVGSSGSVRWLPNFRVRELPADEAVQIGLSYHWVYEAVELTWFGVGIVLTVHVRRLRFD